MRHCWVMLRGTRDLIAEWLITRLIFGYHTTLCVSAVNYRSVIRWLAWQLKCWILQQDKERSDSTKFHGQLFRPIDAKQKTLFLAKETFSNPSTPMIQILPTIFIEKVWVDSMRVYSWISFKLSDADFSALYCISLYRCWKENMYFDIYSVVTEI